MKNKSKTEVSAKVKMIVNPMHLGSHLSPKKYSVFLGIIALLVASLATLSAEAQSSAIRLQIPQVRFTVPVGSNGTIVAISNIVTLANGCTNATLSVSGLPANSTAVLTAGGSVMGTITASTNFVLTLNYTNVAQGLVAFSLNASGKDTNGYPVTNTFPLTLQGAHIWNIAGASNPALGITNSWSAVTNWLGGAPVSAQDDVVFSDSGGQTNLTYRLGLDYTIAITNDIEVASVRFAQNWFTNATVTNVANHSILISSGKTLAITGTNGFSLLHDTIDGQAINISQQPLNVAISGTNSSLLVSNAAANFSILEGNQVLSTLNLTNLGTFKAYVNRVGLSDFQVYPNYLGISAANNVGKTALTYVGVPSKFIDTFYMARTNVIIAGYVNPDNYTNEYTRSYAITDQNCGENSASTSLHGLVLGISNLFQADSICLSGPQSAYGSKSVYFQGVNCSAYFQNTNGQPMTIFTASDGAPGVSGSYGTSYGQGKSLSVVDFSGPTNYVSILAKNFYLARDRTLIASNSNPQYQSTFTIGYGDVNVDTAVLGYQEHAAKTAWPLAQAILGYCKGSLFLTNGGLGTSCNFKVNKNLTLGFTSDTNSSSQSQQYNTYGQITISSNATLSVSNVIVDGGLNYYNDINARQNNITINQGGNLIVTNAIGFNNQGASEVSPVPFSAADPRGMFLDTLTLANGGTLSVFLSASKTNVFSRTVTASGTGGIIKVLGLPVVTNYPAYYTLISYQNTPSGTLTADLSAIGTNYIGLLVNDAANSRYILEVTTNLPNSLVWRGNVSSDWDISTPNWVVKGSGTPTNYNQGDSVTFDDTASNFTVNVATEVFPSQTGVGLLITNNLNAYVFNGSSPISGTFTAVKTGTNTLEMDAAEFGNITVYAGNVSGYGSLGFTRLATNVILNYTGNINGGLVSTGMVFLTGGTLTGPVSIQGGVLVNAGIINTTVGQVVTMVPGTSITNLAGGLINVGSGSGASGSYTWDVPSGATLANFGKINLYQPKLTVEGLLFGTGDGVTGGSINDPNGGGHESIANANASLVRIQGGGIISPGATPTGSIGNMYLYCRFDVENKPNAAATIPGSALIEVDFSNAQTNDTIYCDRWNDDNGYFVMTNINSGAGTFALGQQFQILNNTSGDLYNYIDTLGYCPTLIPYVPVPGLQWGVTNFNKKGIVTITKSSLVWSGVSNSWDTNGTSGAWQSGATYNDNQGAIFDDTATSTTVKLSSIVAPGGYSRIYGTNYTTNVDTTITTNTWNYTNETVISPSIVVSNASKDYIFTDGTTVSNWITGMASLYKTGPGTLTLMGTNQNDFIGMIIVDGGTLAVTNAGASIVSLGKAGVAPQGGSHVNQMILDGGKLNYVGTTNSTISNPLIFNANGASIGVASANYTLTSSGLESGSGALNKTGPGTLILNAANALNTGNVTVGGGALRLAQANAIGSGSLTLSNGVALETTATLTFTNSLNVVSGAVALNVLSGSTSNIFTGPWTGSGSVTFNSAVPFYFNCDISSYSGTLSFGTNSAAYQFNAGATNKNPCLGSALASFDLGTGANALRNLNGSNLVYNLGSLSGGTNTVLAGRNNASAAPAATVYSIGANGTSTTFSGKITNGLDTVTIVKVGAGQLLLNGVSTYTGSTTVSNGVLGGTGSIASPLTVASGGTLSPGVTIGTFTVSNNVTLSGITLMELNRTNSATNDQLVVTGTLTGGGALVVTNVGSTLVNGTTFKLFSKAVTGFSSTNLPTGGSGYVWNNTLSTDGSITLVSGGISANAYLSSITLSPAGALSPGYASNVLNYATTESYSATPTVTVVNADLTATNRLVYNNTTNLLASGVASSPLTLNANPAITNVVKVNVTAQDGVTVLSYTINIKQLPSQTVPFLTNSVSGGVMSFNWPADHTGWSLQVQTNALNIGLTTNWATVPGSTSTNAASAVMSLTNGSVFYRLIYP